MVSVVYSAGLNCLTGYVVSVEADVSDGLPGMELVGYLGSEVKEARERVRMALRNSGCPIPQRRITVNLSPANVRKSGTGFDLAMAVGILKAINLIDDESTRETLFLGELTLSGDLIRINGVLPLVLSAKKAGFKKCFLPHKNAKEGAVVEGIKIYGANNLSEVISHLIGVSKIPLSECENTKYSDAFVDYENDLKYVYGQPFARRGLEIAAAGLHNMLLVGPPGAGKSMLSKCIPSILPPLSMEECLEVSSIYSISGKLGDQNSLITRRPFISPHHTITDSALAGGGINPKAGLIALAHKGVLFLDEMPEFKRSALELLRQPLEDRQIMISRTGGNYTYPAHFMLVGAMNPCPCGNYPDKNLCHCTDAMRDRYLSKISGPLLDRIDICIVAKKVSPTEILNRREEESSEIVRKRVMSAREIQNERFKGTDISFNSQMNNNQIEKYCVLSKKDADLLTELATKHDISARSYFRILRLSRTIADLAGEELIKEEHLLEALRLKLNYK